MTKTQELPHFILTGASLDVLKLLAILYMLADHTNTILLKGSYSVMGYAGCGAFPLFAFVMACHLYRRIPLERYLQKLALFALISQPVYILAFHDHMFNVFATLVLGAAISPWFIEQSTWRRSALCLLTLLWSFFMVDHIDLNLAGILFAPVIVSALLGQRFSKGWAIVLVLSLNVNLSDFFSLYKGHVVWDGLAIGTLLNMTYTALIPMLTYALCRRIPGERFLPKYLFYWFYPGHLLIFAIIRTLRSGVPLSFFSIN